MAELVDAVDSKSTSSDRVPVQVRIRAPDCIIRTFIVRFLLEKVNFLTGSIFCDIIGTAIMKGMDTCMTEFECLFDDVSEDDLFLFTEDNDWIDLGNRFDNGDFNGKLKISSNLCDNSSYYSQFDFDDKELSMLIEKASSLFSRSDVLRAAGVIEENASKDTKVKRYSI